MRSRRDGRVGFTLTATVVLLAALAGPVRAQTGSQTPPSQPIGAVPSDDFLFGRPRVSLGIRGNYRDAQGRQRHLRLRPGTADDREGRLQRPGFSADLGWALTERLDVVGGFEFARKTVQSEYRDFVDNDLRPIEQETQLDQNLLTGSLRFALTPRGTRAGSYAWVPSRFTPYVGAGGGMMWWRFQQIGDFVDFQDFGVFPDTFRSDGLAPTGHLFGGADVQLYKRLSLSVEGRYVWASGTLDEDYVGFEPIDLVGVPLLGGFQRRVLGRGDFHGTAITCHRGRARSRSSACARADPVGGPSLGSLCRLLAAAHGEHQRRHCRSRGGRHAAGASQPEGRRRDDLHHARRSSRWR